MSYPDNEGPAVPNVWQCLERIEADGKRIAALECERDAANAKLGIYMERCWYCCACDEQFIGDGVGEAGSRKPVGECPYCALKAAQSRIRALEAALEPFADVAQSEDDAARDSGVRPHIDRQRILVPLGHCRAARTVLRASGEAGREEGRSL